MIIRVVFILRLVGDRWSMRPTETILWCVHLFTYVDRTRCLPLNLCVCHVICIDPNQQSPLSSNIINNVLYSPMSFLLAVTSRKSQVKTTIFWDVSHHTKWC
jgi:hypothetical protein